MAFAASATLNSGIDILETSPYIYLRHDIARVCNLMTGVHARMIYDMRAYSFVQEHISI